MIVVVLGMHKSGTTLVAETLHHSGIHMADVPDHLGYDESNKFERHEAQRINRRLLVPAMIPTWHGFRVRNAGLDRAGYEINADSVAIVLRRRLRRRLAAADPAPVRELVAEVGAAHPDWGFKDPRTCMTYEYWERSLPAHRIVAVYRPFAEVLLRYKVAWTSPVRLLRVARSWIVHNEMLARHLERSDDAIVLRYDELMGSDAELARLADHLGVEIVDRRRADLYRARGSSATAPVRLPGAMARRAARVEARLDRLRDRQLAR